MSPTAQLVEVLPRAEYDDEHLHCARHLPLKSLTAEAAAALDRGHPVIVYCWDSLRDMSHRAACRLERFGFDPVFDYTAGKADWRAAGLLTEGKPHPARVLDAADRHPVTCGPGRHRGGVASGDKRIGAICRARDRKRAQSGLSSEHVANVRTRRASRRMGDDARPA